MPNLRPVPISESPPSSWQNIIQKTVQSQNVIAGSGLRRTLSTGDFTQLSVDGDIDFDHLVWRGNYTESAEYQLNDVVRVLPYNKFHDDFGNVIPIGSTDQPIDQDLGDIIPISLGLFVCVNHVPPSWATTEYFSSTVVPAFPDVVPYGWQDGIRWSDYNIYYPIFPEIPTQYTASIASGFGFNITVNNTFWQAMPFGVLPTKLCQNGIEKDFYVLGVPSGSKFDTSNLPYNP